MVFYNSAYPQRIKPILKTGPSLFLVTSLLLLWPVLINIKQYRLYERNEKLLYKSNYFERMMRDRQDRFIYFIYPTLYSQP